MLKRLLNNEKGSAMLMAIMGLAVISVFTVTAVLMGSSNVRQTQAEGKRTQAYYVADAGAKSLINHLKTKVPADELVEELEKMSEKEDIKGEYKDWTFEIDVEEIEEGKEYEITSTSEVDEVRDGTTAILRLEETSSSGGGSGLEMGDGVIFITDSGNDTLQFHSLKQFKTNVSIFTRNKSVMQINDKPSGDGYTTTSSDVDGVIKDMFVRKDHTVEAVYNLNKDMVMGKYLDEGSKSNAYFLPITNEDEYDAYVKSSDIFPLVSYKVPKGETDRSKSIPARGDLDLTGDRYVKISDKLTLDRNLDIKTSGDVDIVFNKEFHIKKGSTFKIYADGRVNMYFEKQTDTSGGHIEVISEGPNSQVNFYVGNRVPFQIQTGTKVTGGVNLYAPTSDVQFQENTRWEGIVVANELEFNDNVQFRAPSAGADPSDMNKDEDKEWTLDEIEWKEWKK